MRPTDQNQAGSRRPNLMSSSRRAGGEINILAMLDGQSGKPRRARKLAWIGAGTLLTCALGGGLAWLLHAPSGGFDDHRIAVDLPDPKPAAVPPVDVPPVDVPPARVPPALVPASLPETARYAEEGPPQGATIVEPPSHDAAAVFPAEMLPDEMKAHGSARMAAPRPAAASIQTASTQTSAAKPAAHVAAPRPAPRTASSMPRQEAPVRARRGAATVKPVPAPATVDTDVALISAIIQHVNQRGELQDNAKSSTKQTPTQP